MFRLEDGRELFYQWDIGRRLIISDETVKQVHFCNKTDDCSLVCEVYEEGGVRLVDVPNILLQESWPINVYAYCGDNYTKTSKIFKVKARTKPDSYVYVETEVLTWEQLSERIEQNKADIETKATIEYVDDRDGVVLTDAKSFTKDYTDYKVGQIEIPDVSGFATTDYVDEKVGQIEIPDTSTFATTEYVDKAVENVDVDLTGYATEKYVDDAIAAIDIPEGGGESIKEIAISTTEPTDENVVLWINPNETGEDYATTAYVDERDGVVLTAAKEYTDEKVGAIVIPDTSNLATKDEIPDVSGFTTMAAVEAKGYQTEDDVNTLINTALGVIENGTY